MKLTGAERLTVGENREAFNAAQGADRAVKAKLPSHGAEISLGQRIGQGGYSDEQQWAGLQQIDYWTQKLLE